jgi:hypothetical protein
VDIDSNRDFRGVIRCSVIGDGLLLYNAAAESPETCACFAALSAPLSNWITVS